MRDARDKLAWKRKSPDYWDLLMGGRVIGGAEKLDEGYEVTFLDYDAIVEADSLKQAYDACAKVIGWTPCHVENANDPR